MSTPAQDLLAALAHYEQAHRAAEEAYTRLAPLEEAYSSRKTQITEDVAADTAFKNADARKAEVQRRLTSNGNGNLLNQLADAETCKRRADADLARAEQSLKTLRAVVAYYTSELNLEAERLRASSVATYAEPQPTLYNGRYAEPARPSAPTPIPAELVEMGAAPNDAMRPNLYIDDDLPF